MPHADLSAPAPAATELTPHSDAAMVGNPRAQADALGALGALERLLLDEPTSFSFFQAVRLLTQLRSVQGDRAEIGRWADPGDEVVRFTASTSLAFPASEIQSLKPDERDAEALRMMVNFIGLTGPQGVLPHVYTERASAHARAGDPALRDFLDLFHHRAISLFYRSWEKHRAVVVQELRGEDRLRDHLLDLAGLGAPGLRNRSPLPDDLLAFYSGLYAGRTRSADGFARLIGDYFDVPATVEQFAGAWRRVDAGGQCALGADGDAGRLGSGVLGDAAWDPHDGIRLRIGPLDRRQFDAFLPGGAAHEPLRALARFYVDDQMSVDAQLVLAHNEVSRCTLLPPEDAARAGSPALGRGTWLTSRTPTRDPDDLVIRICE
ncbi:MAG TPA: type VI secretion system baseplate subunit TssG [Gemmatimonadaceae bacterium]|nr:type VI secretion system baseplate subunit TssG [Gemmatimonadaceae bacterium]